MPLDQLSLAKNRIVGTKEVLRAVESKDATLVFVAQDADAEVVGPIKANCERYGVPLELVKTRTLLGEACGIDVGAATAAILKD